MDADGSNQTRLTEDTGSDLSPAWSPDGSRIAFTSCQPLGPANDGTARECDIYVMNVDGSGQANLTDNPADDRHPAWSPDGTRIAFDSDRDGDVAEIYVMNADGSGQTNLTNRQNADDSQPAWSPMP